MAHSSEIPYLMHDKTVALKEYKVINRVFLSYSKYDVPIVNKFISSIKTKNPGAKIIHDDQFEIYIKLSGRITNEEETELNERLRSDLIHSDLIVFFLSKAAIKSKLLLSEISLIIDEANIKKISPRIVTVVFDLRLEVPFFLRNYHVVYLTKNANAAKIDELVFSILEPKEIDYNRESDLAKTLQKRLEIIKLETELISRDKNPEINSISLLGSARFFASLIFIFIVNLSSLAYTLVDLIKPEGIPISKILAVILTIASSTGILLAAFYTASTKNNKNQEVRDE